MSKKRILVCGGAGFIGSNFANFHKNTYEIIVLDNLLLGDEKNLDEGIIFVKGSAADEKVLDEIGPVDYVFNLAGTSSQPMFNGDGLVKGYVNSIESFMRVLDWSAKNGIKKVLYASTSSLYANNPLPLVETQSVTPPNHYAVTKHLYESASRCFNTVHPNMDIIGFRFMSIYGPNEEAKGEYANLVSQFVWDVARGSRPQIWGDGSQTRDFTNVKDVVHAVTLAMESDKKFGAEIFNIGTGRSTSLNDVTEAIYKAFDKENNTEYIENPVKETYIKDQYADISKIRKELGFEPSVELSDGIKEQVKNLRMSRIRHTSSDLMRKK